MQQYHTPSECIEKNMLSAVVKATLPLGRMILLGIMAGAFIALGAATSNTAVHQIENIGLARTIAGCIFPIGLMLIVFVGGELFTGNCLMYMSVLDRRIRLMQFVRNLLVVYFSNFIGAFLIAALVYLSGNFAYSNGLLGAYTIKVMVGKVSISPLQAITSGILCNVLVCAAILMATAAQDAAGKILAIFFPILAFIVGGFEHCVANMYYIPAGFLAAKQSIYVDMAVNTYGLSADLIHSLSVSDLLHNLLPVTIGNLLGGSICLGTSCYFAHKKQ